MDIKINDGDIVIDTNDITITNNDFGQNIVDTIVASTGEWRQYPLSAGNIEKIINSNNGQSVINNAIKVVEADGFSADDINRYLNIIV